MLQRLLDGRIRKGVEMVIGEDQQRFRKGGVMEGMFMLRQMVEKRL